jgi:hypothetical protein
VTADFAVHRPPNPRGRLDNLGLSRG